ncbi:MAG: adenine deaminase C-terminal domain-containing protein [Streptosporangiaceae bacterium]
MAAIQACTVAPAEYLGLRHDIGSIAPGRLADILFAADLHDLRPHLVIADGTDVWPTPQAARGAGPAPRYRYPASARESVTLPAGLAEADLRIPASGDRVTVRAIGMVDRVVPTGHLLVDTAVRDGEVRGSVAEDLVKIALVNRHGGVKQAALGFVHGLGLQAGAIAQSTARDTHHLLAVGTSDADMITAMRTVAAAQGGIAVVRDGAVLACLRLPMAGLLSDGPVEEVAGELRGVIAAIRELGCTLEQPTTMLAMLAVSAIPELRIGNRGLIDSREYVIVPPVIS